MRQHRQNIFDQYENLVASMELPAIRKLATPANALWFLRNGILINRHHKNAEKARELAVKIANLH